MCVSLFYFVDMLQKSCGIVNLILCPGRRVHLAEDDEDGEKESANQSAEKKGHAASFCSIPFLQTLAM